MIVHDLIGPIPTALTPDEFNFECATIAREARMGIDHEPAEVAERLGVPLSWLLFAAAYQHAATTGEPVTILPFHPKETMQ